MLPFDFFVMLLLEHLEHFFVVYVSDVRISGFIIMDRGMHFESRFRLILLLTIQVRLIFSGFLDEYVFLFGRKGKDEIADQIGLLETLTQTWEGIIKIVLKLIYIDPALLSHVDVVVNRLFLKDELVLDQLFPSVRHLKRLAYQIIYFICLSFSMFCRLWFTLLVWKFSTF